MEKLYGTLQGEGKLTGELTTAKASVSISVDSDVITGEPGTAARVDNLGTNKDAILKFTIPRGAKGEAGEPGTPGQDGKDGNDGPMGPKGESGDNGTTFTPQVSAAGVISWTNDGGKENPQPVSIKGPAGETGSAGPAGPTGETGPQGPAGQNGQDGSDGVTFTPSVSAAGVISWTNDGGKTNPQSVNIKGPAGQDGKDGKDGEAGPAGKDGQDGQNGQDGSDGVTFTPSVSAAGVISWTNDGGKTNPNPVNIKGPAGDDYVLTTQDKQDIADLVVAEIGSADSTQY
jgi:hypothetical protein